MSKTAVTKTLLPDARSDRSDTAVAILTDISLGMLVTHACARHGTTRTALHRWTTENPALRDAYARAREDQAHAMAEETVALADTATAETAQAVRLQVDARKWLTSKIAPRVYGEKLQTEHDMKGNIRITVTRDA